MSEIKKTVDLDAPNHSIYLSQTTREFLQNNIERLTGSPATNYKSFTELFTSILQKLEINDTLSNDVQNQELINIIEALKSEKEHLLQQSRELQNVLQTAEQEIKKKNDIVERQTEILKKEAESKIKLQQQLKELELQTTEHRMRIMSNDTESQKQIEKLQAQNIELELQLENAKANSTPQPSTVVSTGTDKEVLELNDFQREILQLYVSNEKIQNSFVKLNNYGKYTGFIDVLPTTNPIPTFLKNCFFGSLLNLQPIKLTDSNQIKNGFEKFKKSNS